MTTECEETNLQYYNSNPSFLGTCTPYEYTCICNSTFFVNWFLTTICNNCNGDAASQDPLQLLTDLCNNVPASVQEESYTCSSFTSAITSTLLGGGSTSDTQNITATSAFTATPLSLITSSSSMSSPSNQTLFLSSSSITSTPFSTTTSTSVIPAATNFHVSKRLSKGAKAGIGLGATVLSAAVILLPCWVLWRRKRSPTYYRRKESGITEGAAEADNCLTSIRNDDDGQQGTFYPRVSVEEYQGTGNGFKGQTGFIPARGMRGEDEGISRNQRTSGVVMSARYIEGERSLEDMNGAGNLEHESNSIQDHSIPYSRAENGDAGIRRLIPSRCSGIGTGQLDLGQSEMSHEELAQLEDEERRIDEAIRESERFGSRLERDSVDTGI